MSIEAMKQALEALECAISDNKPYLTKCVNAIKALRQAIEEAEEKPMSIEVMKQALEALYPISHNSTDDPRGQADKAITALRQAIAEAEHELLPDENVLRQWKAEFKEQEPVAWMQSDHEHISLWKDAYHTIPLYTHPQREWIGLTHKERDEICLGDEGIARAIEAKLKEKNT